MPQPVRSFHIVGDQFTELEALPEALPPTGYLWVATTRAAFEAALPDVQARLQAWTGAQLFELHVLDLLNKQLPSTLRLHLGVRPARVQAARRRRDRGDRRRTGRRRRGTRARST